MTSEEINKKVERLRTMTDAKLKFLRDHSTFLEQAFEELKEVTEEELDIVYEKIQELDARTNKNGLSK